MKKGLLKGKGICKSFSSDVDAAFVLDHVDIEIFEGDFTVIMGASGAGKSTLLYALSGMDSITDGEVDFQGKKISDLSEHEMARLRAEEFGFVFQQTHLVSNLTLLENVAVAGYACRTKSARDIRERAMQLLVQMHVDGAKNRLPHQVSGGEAQRAAIARAVINHPGLIFADEPTGALNKANSTEVLDLMTELNRNGQSILMVTHDIRSAVRGNRILYLEDGKILDELELNGYREDDAKVRETAVSDWLSSLRW